MIVIIIKIKEERKGKEVGVNKIISMASFASFERY
jgi:hypothetical protein